ncbi:MAG: hypothetical protein HYW37_00930 [Candidatus Colwellbacteria bacterium]|nr:hypothetical protein [Candidatus Colwellbacteria bacterium]
MTKIFIVFISALLFAPGLVSQAQGQTMFKSVTPEIEEHTKKEEAEGKTLWEKLQSKQLNCSDLNDGDFEALGEYFMGTMMGNSHAVMNAMMISMMGESGEEQAHLVMGKRLSGCDTSAAFSSQAGGFMPMMQIMLGGMMGNWSNPWTYNSWGIIGLIGTLFWIGLLILLFLAIVKLWRSIDKENKDKND